VNGISFNTFGMMEEAFKTVEEDLLWRDREKMLKRGGPVSYGVGVAGTTY